MTMRCAFAPVPSPILQSQSFRVLASVSKLLVEPCLCFILQQCMFLIVQHLHGAKGCVTNVQ